MVLLMKLSLRGQTSDSWRCARVSTGYTQARRATFRCFVRGQCPLEARELIRDLLIPKFC